MLADVYLTLTIAPSADVLGPAAAAQPTPLEYLMYLGVSLVSLLGPRPSHFLPCLPRSFPVHLLISPFPFPPLYSRSVRRT